MTDEIRLRVMGLTPGESPFRSGYEWRLPLLGLAGLALFAWLYVFDAPVYYFMLARWMDTPYARPFIDLEGVVAAHACWKQGIDVYVHTPCDPLDRAFNYSPVWLRMDFLPTDRSSTPWLGWALDGAFLCSLGALPRLKRGVGLVALGAFGSLPAFAMERGNFDLLIFALALAAAAFLAKGPRMRSVGYCLIALAGGLKFYPLTAFLLAARERLRNAVGIALLFVGAAVVFIWRFRSELNEVTLPDANPFLNGVGARGLPDGIRALLAGALEGRGASRGATAAMVSLSVGFVWVALCAGLAYGLATIVPRREFGLALERLPERAHLTLLMGAAIVCGCFFAFESIGYRGVLLLLTLPVLLGLAQDAECIWTRRLFASAANTTVLVLWMLTIQQGVALAFGGSYYPVRGSAAGYLFWIFRELSWWWIATVLSAVLIRFALDSPTAAYFRPLAPAFASTFGLSRKPGPARKV